MCGYYLDLHDQFSDQYYKHPENSKSNTSSGSIKTLI